MNHSAESVHPAALQSKPDANRRESVNRSEYSRTLKVDLSAVPKVQAQNEAVAVAVPRESCIVRCLCFLGIQVFVPVITLAHIYILSQRNAYDPSCESRFFYSLPALASGSLLCCLLSLFVTNLTMTNAEHLLPSAFFTAISTVYIALGGGLTSATFHLDPTRHSFGSLSELSSNNICGRSFYVTLFLTGSMFCEFCVTLLCFGYVLIQLECQRSLQRPLPRKKIFCIVLFSAGLGLTQSVAPLYLNSENFRNLFFSSPCAHIDFVLESTCMYLCIFATQTKSPSMKMLYTIIAIESMLLQWPSFGLDLAFLKLSSSDCSHGTECHALTRLYVGITLKFLAVQFLGLFEAHEKIRDKCQKSKQRLPENKQVPLLSDPAAII